jgi:chromosome segregation ATPase
MPRRTDGDKIDELEKVVATLSERLDNLRADLNRAGTAIEEASTAFSAFKIEVALLKQQIEILQRWKEDLKKEGEERARRMWSFGPNLVGAVVNVLLSALVSGVIAYLATRH